MTNSEIIEFCENIIRLDKTRYGYSRSRSSEYRDNNGEAPPSGRWCTPREKAEEIILQLEALDGEEG